MRKHIAFMGTLANIDIADSMIVINGGERSKVIIINYGVESARRRLRYIPLYEPPQQFSGIFWAAICNRLQRWCIIKNFVPMIALELLEQLRDGGLLSSCQLLQRESVNGKNHFKSGSARHFIRKYLHCRGFLHKYFYFFLHSKNMAKRILKNPNAKIFYGISYGHKKTLCEFPERGNGYEREKTIYRATEDTIEDWK
jgi:hypothetical protein